MIEDERQVLRIYECPRCGFIFADDIPICPRCGEELDDIEPIEEVELDD